MRRRRATQRAPPGRAWLAGGERLPGAAGNVQPPEEAEGACGAEVDAPPPGEPVAAGALWRALGDAGGGGVPLRAGKPLSGVKDGAAAVVGEKCEAPAGSAPQALSEAAARCEALPTGLPRIRRRPRRRRPAARLWRHPPRRRRAQGSRS
jgi:hypothetical protein